MAQSLLRHGFMHDTGPFQWDRALSAEALRHPEVHYIIHWCKFYPTYSRPLHRGGKYTQRGTARLLKLFLIDPHIHISYSGIQDPETRL